MIFKDIFTKFDIHSKTNKPHNYGLLNNVKCIMLSDPDDANSCHGFFSEGISICSFLKACGVNMPAAPTALCWD